MVNGDAGEVAGEWDGGVEQRPRLQLLAIEVGAKEGRPDVRNVEPEYECEPCPFGERPATERPQSNADGHGGDRSPTESRKVPCGAPDPIGR